MSVESSQGDLFAAWQISMNWRARSAFARLHAGLLVAPGQAEQIVDSSAQRPELAVWTPCASFCDIGASTFDCLIV